MPFIRRLAFSVLVYATSTLAACGSSSSGESPTAGPRAPGQVGFSAPTYTVDESSTTVAIDVLRVGGSDGTITVEVSAADGSALSGSDYSALTETLTFADGDTGRTVEIELSDDVVDEPDETILLSLSNVTGGASLGSPSTAEVIIADDEPDEFKIGLTVSGLRGDGLILRNHGGTDLEVSADGSYEFPAILFEGDRYDVSVSVQPWEPAQTCSIVNGDGIVGQAGIEGVEVSCDNAVLQSLVVGRSQAGQGAEKADLYAVREDGELPLQLTSTYDVVERIVTVHGDRIIFIREELSTLRYSAYSINSDGTLETVLTRYPSPILGGISEAGIAVYSSDGNLYAVDVHTGEHNDLLVSPDEDRVEHVTSEGRVVFSRTIRNQADLFAIDIDGLNLVPLATAPDHETFSSITTSQRLIYYSQQENGDNRRDLYSVGLDGTGTNPISEEPDANQYFAGQLNAGVLIVQLFYDSGEEELYAIQDDGSWSRRLVVNQGEVRFEGAAPGQRIVYTVDGGTGGSHDVYIVDLDGVERLALAASSDDEYLADFTADGAPIVERHTDGQIDLVRVELDGSRETAIALSPLNDELVAVAQDDRSGRLILQRGDAAAGAQLISIRPDGSDERLLADNARYAYSFAQVARGNPSRYGSVFYYDDTDRLWRVGTDGSAAIPLTPLDERAEMQWLLEN